MAKKSKKDLSRLNTSHKPPINIDVILSDSSLEDQLRSEMEKFLIPLALLAAKYKKLKKNTEMARSIKPLIEQLLDFAELEEINPKTGEKFSPLLHINRNRKKNGVISKVIIPGYITRKGQVIVKATVEIK